MEKRKIIKVNGKLGLGSDQVALKSQVSSARSFLAVLVFLLMFQLMSCECFLVVYIYIYIYIYNETLKQQFSYLFFAYSHVQDKREGGNSFDIVRIVELMTTMAVFLVYIALTRKVYLPTG